MKRILIIEDDLLMIHIIELIVQKEGFETDLAYNGKEAALMLRLQAYDLVITDLKLPFPHLRELTTVLQEQKKERHLPVIAIIPAAFLADTVYSWFNIEAEEIIIKPFCPYDLTALISRQLYID